MRHEREEIATVGFDDFATLAPDAFGVPVRTGIRLPALAGVRYRVLCASAQLDEGDAVTHLRQFLQVGSQYSTSIDPPNVPPFYPFVQDVRTSTWKFNDGNVVWSLTTEPNPPFRATVGPWDQASFHYDDADGAALLYATAGFPPVKGLPGYLALNAYTPPPMRGTLALVMRDMRNPWDDLHADQIRIPIVRPTKIRVYADVLQTNASTRYVPSLATETNPYNVTGLCPEDNMLQLFRDSLRYWAVGCALGIERRRTVEIDRALENEPGR